MSRALRSSTHFWHLLLLLLSCPRFFPLFRVPLPLSWVFWPYVAGRKRSDGGRGMRLETGLDVSRASVVLVFRSS